MTETESKWCERVRSWRASGQTAKEFALDPIDLRYSFDRLSGLAKEQVGYDPRGGALFVFFGRRRTALKLLFFDGSGMCVFYKRLDQGTFRVPESPADGAHHVEVDDAMLDALLDGVAVEAATKSSVH
jgi:transposase